jgi:hypothetical protein
LSSFFAAKIVGAHGPCFPAPANAGYVALRYLFDLIIARRCGRTIISEGFDMAETNENPPAGTGETPVSGKSTAKTRKASAGGARQAPVMETREESAFETRENSVAETSAKSIPETGEESLTEIKQDSAINSSVDPVAGIVEAALAEDFEVLEKLGNEGAKAAESVARSCSGSIQMFATETADYAKQCFESRAAFAGALLGTKSFESAVQVQTSYAKSAYARFLAHLLKMSGLYWNLLGEATSRPKE